ncbi:metallophosphoesterase [Chungangia koreensis]|uniref:Phosphoesterase n=1 Tax=Chungangia koreensis TaxID=752657 RepID=A0ABV8X3I4_9LACT
MKILVMSDTHGDAQVIQHVRTLHSDVDAVFHCGDSELTSDHEVLKGIHIVQGNCDWGEAFPEEKVIEVEGSRIYITHGHLFNVKNTLMPLKYRAEEKNADVVLFGHSHLLGAEMDNGVLFLNPGSLKQPRGRNEKSYAIIQRKSDNWQVQFYSDEGILLEDINL